MSIYILFYKIRVSYHVFYYIVYGYMDSYLNKITKRYKESEKIR